MLQFFQNIRPVSAIYVLIFGLLLRIPFLFFGFPSSFQFGSGFMQDVFDAVNQNTMLSVSLGFILVFIQALIFNRLCIDYDVIYHHSYLPAYFFILLNSMYPANMLFNSVMVVNIFLLLAFSNSFKLYQTNISSIILFYTALFIGIGALFIPEFYFGVFFIVFGTMVFKNISLKDILSIIIGLLFPIAMTLGIAYLFEAKYTIPKINYRIDLDINLNGQNYVAAGVVAVLTAFGLLKSSFNYSKNNIRTRRIYLFLIMYLLFALGILLFRNTQAKLYFPIITFGCAVHLSYLLIGSKKKRLKEFVNYLLIIAVIFSIYGKWIVKAL